MSHEDEDLINGEMKRSQWAKKLWLSNEDAYGARQLCVNTWIKIGVHNRLVFQIIDMFVL